jgi:predicted small integral membrane protein
MTNPPRLPRTVQIGLLIVLFTLAYVAGKFSGLSGSNAWWMAKGSFMAANTILILLVLEACRRDRQPAGQQE